MSADRAAILSWLSDLVAALVSDAIDRRDLTRRVAAASALDAPAFAQEALSIIRIVAESAVEPSDFDRLVIPPKAADGTIEAMTVMLALALAVSGVRIDWPSRPAARSARSRMAEAGEAGLLVASSLGSDGADLYTWLAGVVSAAVRLVSEVAANSVPVVRVETQISMPSTLLAYRLYGDAARAGGVVDIGRSATPLLMPSGFDALAS